MVNFNTALFPYRLSHRNERVLKGVIDITRIVAGYKQQRIRAVRVIKCDVCLGNIKLVLKRCGNFTDKRGNVRVVRLYPLTVKKVVGVVFNLIVNASVFRVFNVIRLVHSVIGQERKKRKRRKQYNGNELIAYAFLSFKLIFLSSFYFKL